MKILILGGRGMLGHRLWSTLGQDHEVWGSLRKGGDTLPQVPGISRDHIIENLDVFDHERLGHIITSLKPNVVINCIGIIKQIKDSKDHITSIHTNALLPHIVAKICSDNGMRFIHFSTDCVFDGSQGFYREEDSPNATDLYGRTKFLGEVSQIPNGLTLRTSIIGRELESKGSLIDWFLTQEGSIQGYRKAIFSGFPTQTIALILRDFILPHQQLSGLYHLSSDPIDKFSLLNRVKKLFDKDIEIHENNDFRIDRSLDSSKLQQKIGPYPTDWNEVISDLAVDRSFYQSLNA